MSKFKLEWLGYRDSSAILPMPSCDMVYIHACRQSTHLYKIKISKALKKKANLEVLGNLLQSGILTFLRSYKRPLTWI